MTESSLEVPMAWLWAEFVADTLVSTSAFHHAPPAPEYRATRDVLALSLLFTGVADLGAPMTDSDLELVSRYMSHEDLWLVRCRSGLDGHHRPLGRVERQLAKDAWLWLVNHQITPARETAKVLRAYDIAQSCYRLGLSGARRVIAVHLLA